MRGLDVEEDIDSSTLQSARERIIEVAFMGRQNVGKSSLLNAILNDDRVLTGSLSGLTRL